MRPELKEGPCAWLIRKGGYFYRPSCSGYTTSKAEAGRYSEAEAKREASVEPWHMSAVLADEVPDPPYVTDKRDAETSRLTEEVERLKAQVSFTLSDSSRLLRKEDIIGACPNPDDCFHEGRTARCGPCAIKASAARGVAVSDTRPHLPEVCRLQRELKAAEARVKELEAALAPFAKEADQWAETVPDKHRSLCTEPGARTAHPGSETGYTVGDLRRARSVLHFSTEREG